MTTLFFKWILWTLLFQICSAETPSIVVSNITVPVGHEAVLSCVVENLGHHKAAWVRQDSKTILTVHKHIITRSKKVKMSTPEPGIWNLHINDVRESDRGYYSCLINTDPLTSQTAYLEVVENNKPDDTNATKLNETNNTEKRPDEDSSPGCCLPAYTTITICFIFVAGTVFLYKVLF